MRTHDFGKDLIEATRILAETVHQIRKVKETKPGA
jgi:hypothetical protein